MTGLPKEEGIWKRITLMKGFPTAYEGEKYFTPVLFIKETSAGRIQAAQKDPRVKTRKGVDEELLGNLILAGCLMIRAKDLISAETAQIRIDAYDSGDMETYEQTGETSLFPDSEHEWYILPESLKSDLILMGDNSRLSKAFKAINRIQDEELSDFFG